MRAPSSTVSPTSALVGVLAGPGAWGYPSDERRWMLAEAGLVVSVAAAIASFGIDVYSLAASLDAKVSLIVIALSSATSWLAMGTARVAALFPAPLSLAACRLGALTLVLGTWSAAGRNLETLQLWPLGAVGGFECFITLRSIGVMDSPAQLARRAFGSPANLGAAVGCLLLGALDLGGVGWSGAGRIYAGIVLCAFVGMVAIAAAHYAEERAVDEAERYRNEGRMTELAARANWLHNEVIGTINPVRQRTLGSDDSEMIKTGELLDEIIQEWRTTQLDLAIASRPIRLAEIISHVSRSYRRLGIDVAAPGAESGQLVLAGASADCTYQALTMTMSNAANAGAKRIDLHVTVEPDHLLMRIVDDGSGFAPDRLPQGRGLDRLNQLLAYPVDIASDSDHTTVTVRVERGGSGG